MSLIEIVWGGGALLGGGIRGRAHLPGQPHRAGQPDVPDRRSLPVPLSELLPPSGFLWFALFTVTSGYPAASSNASFTQIVQTASKRAYFSAASCRSTAVSGCCRQPSDCSARDFSSTSDSPRPRHRRNGHRFWSATVSSSFGPPPTARHKKTAALFRAADLASGHVLRMNVQRCNRFSDTSPKDWHRCSTKRIFHIGRAISRQIVIIGFETAPWVPSINARSGKDCRNWGNNSV